jgi:hypothetical protein
VKRNRLIGLALALALCGLSPARAETFRQPRAKEQPYTKADKTMAPEKPSAVRQLFDLLLRKQVAPAVVSPIRTSPIELDFVDPDLALCTDVLDSTTPCRVHMPVPG